MINDQVTVIIPIHDISDPNFKKYFDNAINSIKNNKVLPMEVLLVYPDKKAFKDELQKYEYGALVVRHIPHSKSTSYQSQLNIGAENVKSKYFSFLEFDDEYSSIWFDNVTKYIEQNQEIDMFLPIISDVNEENDFIGYSNEVAWALNFSNEGLGMLDHDTLSDFPNINIDGMVINTEAYLKCGGLKESIRLSFNYEFLLRFTNLSHRIMVIPKIGYKHVNMRENSIFWKYRNDDSEIITPDEAKFWMKTAKEEFYHKKDRGITYVINETLDA